MRLLAHFFMYITFELINLAVLSGWHVGDRHPQDQVQIMLLSPVLGLPRPKMIPVVIVTDGFTEFRATAWNKTVIILTAINQ